MKTLAALICLLAVTLPAPAWAQKEPQPLGPGAAKEKILQCLAENDAKTIAMAAEATDADSDALGSYEDCIGAASPRCFDADGRALFAVGDCLAGEIDAWERLTTEWMAEAVAIASPERARILETSQALWRTAMERSLDLYGAYYQENSGGLGDGRMWLDEESSDRLQMTATRALWVKRVLQSDPT